MLWQDAFDRQCDRAAGEAKYRVATDILGMVHEIGDISKDGQSRRILPRATEVDAIREVLEIRDRVIAVRKNKDIAAGVTGHEIIARTAIQHVAAAASG